MGRKARNVRGVVVLVLAVCVLSVFAGCKISKSKSYTFDVETGDQVTLTLDTTDDYDITSKLPFSISHDQDVLMQGKFILGDGYEQYVEAVHTDEKAQLLDSGTKDGNDYIFWCYNNMEYNYVVYVNGSDTGVILSCPVSEDAAKACFERLTITLEHETNTY